MTVTLPERGQVNLGVKGTFDYDEFRLPPATTTDLDQLKTVVKKFVPPNKQITVAGHTDSIGNSDYNKNLSQRRADSAVEYLKKNEGLKNPLTAEGHGEENLKVVDHGDDPTEKNKEAQAANRRVEVTIDMDIPEASRNKDFPAELGCYNRLQIDYHGAGAEQYRKKREERKEAIAQLAGDKTRFKVGNGFTAEISINPQSNESTVTVYRGDKAIESYTFKDQYCDLYGEHRFVETSIFTDFFMSAKTSDQEIEDAIKRAVKDKTVQQRSRYDEYDN